MRRPRSLTFRLVFSAGLWTLFALVAAGIVLSLLFQASIERSFDARLSVLLDSLIVAADFDETRGPYITAPLGEPRFDQPYAGWYWQITPHEGTPILSRSLWDKELNPDLDRPAPEIRHYYDSGPDDQRVRVAERDITFVSEGNRVRFSVAAVTTESSQEVSNFVWAIVWSLGALGIGLVSAVIVQVKYGLRPLRHLSESLGKVRAGADDRLAGDYPAEIAPLATELNALIDHNAEVVDRARTHVGNLAHALKTPMTVLANDSENQESQLARLVKRQVDVMRRHVDHYLTRARTAATGKVLGARTLVRPVIQALASTVMRIYAERNVSVSVEGGERVNFRGERQDLEEMLGNLMDNACKWAVHQIRVRAVKSDDRVIFTVEDDGPGISEDQLETVFGRGQRYDEAVPGSGLGLDIVRDISALYGGKVALGRSDMGGLLATLELPAAADAGGF